MPRNFAILLALSAFVWAQNAPDWMNRSVQAFRNAAYQDAIADFQQAIRLDPTNPSAHLYLATAYMTLWIPGADSTANIETARAAETEFRRVMDLDPKDVTPLPLWR